MKGFPKIIKTRKDIEHCVEMARAGRLSSIALRQAVDAIYERSYLHCPIQEISEDRITVVITYCPEATAVEAGNAVITYFSHVVNPDRICAGMDVLMPTDTVLTLANPLPDGETVIKIPSGSDPLAVLGMTAEELDEIMEGLDDHE